MSGELKAGRALDAKIAETVMGRLVTWLPTALSASDPHVEGENVAGFIRCRSYSTDIAAAWEVVTGVEFTTGEFSVSRTAGDEFYAEYVGVLSGDCRRASVYADSAPLAICLAALKAVAESGK